MTESSFSRWLTHPADAADEQTSYRLHILPGLGQFRLGDAPPVEVEDRVAILTALAEVIALGAHLLAVVLAADHDAQRPDRETVLRDVDHLDPQRVDARVEQHDLLLLKLFSSALSTAGLLTRRSVPYRRHPTLSGGPGSAVAAALAVMRGGLGEP